MPEFETALETLPSFRTELERLINRHSRENGSDTPDFILAGYLIDCLESYDRAVKARQKWYAIQPPTVVSPDGKSFMDKP